MSWYSGSQDTITSSSASSAARDDASMLATSTRSGIITPFGSLVEPLVYCRMTSRSGSCAGISRRSADGHVGGAGHDGVEPDGRRIARRRRVEVGQERVDQQQRGVAVDDAGARAVDERVERAHAHRQRQDHARQPGEPAALDGGDQLTRRGTEDGHVVAGHQAAGLERGADGAGLVVDLRPRDERVALGRGDGRADEAHPVGAVGGGDEPLDDPGAGPRQGQQRRAFWHASTLTRPRAAESGRSRHQGILVGSQR